MADESKKNKVRRSYTALESNDERIDALAKKMKTTKSALTERALRNFYLDMAEHFDLPEEWDNPPNLWGGLREGAGRKREITLYTHGSSDNPILSEDEIYMLEDPQWWRREELQISGHNVEVWWWRDCDLLEVIKRAKAYIDEHSERGMPE